MKSDTALSMLLVVIGVEGVREVGIGLSFPILIDNLLLP